MASRPILSPFAVIEDGDMSGNIISEVTIIQNTSAIGYDISWSGTGLSGTFSVQTSNTYTKNADGSEGNPGNWTTIPLSVTPTVSTDTGSGYINVVAIAGYAMRLVYSATGGTGVLNALVCGKVG